MSRLQFPKLILSMKFTCKRHNEVTFKPIGFFGFKRKPIKTKINGITRGKVYEGQVVNIPVWEPDYTGSKTYIYIYNDAGKWEYYDTNLFKAE